MLGSSLVMGVAVCGMHFVGMAALMLMPGDSLPVGFEQGVRGDRLGLMTFAVVIALLALALALGMSIARQQRRAAVTI
jgi:NO-binding membrane sensor protein with MHYT domain